MEIEPTTLFSGVDMDVGWIVYCTKLNLKQSYVSDLSSVVDECSQLYMVSVILMESD